MSLQDLYDKINDFSDKSDKNQISHCKKGCSRCCYVDLSIFETEADVIRQWYSHLSSNEKAILKEKWSTPLPTALNFFEEPVKACPFLYRETCTIYEARPLICRTQGLPLKFTLDSDIFADICPLNEDMLENLEEKEFLNLDLLNLILSKLEIQSAEGKERARIRLEDLRTELSSDLLE